MVKIALLAVLFFVGSFTHNNATIKVIYASVNNPYLNYYPKDCIIADNHAKLLIDRVYIYKNSMLKYYEGKQTEGLYTFDFEEVPYSKEELAYKKLSITRNGNYILWFGKKYDIGRIANDTIFTKPTSDNYLIIVGSLH